MSQQFSGSPHRDGRDYAPPHAVDYDHHVPRTAYHPDREVPADPYARPPPLGDIRSYPPPSRSDYGYDAAPRGKDSLLGTPPVPPSAQRERSPTPRAARGGDSEDEDRRKVFVGGLNFITTDEVLKREIAESGLNLVSGSHLNDHHGEYRSMNGVGNECRT